MKTRTSLLVLAAAALSAALLPSVSAAPRPIPAMAFPCRAVELPMARTVERGTTALTLQQYLGAPHEKLSPDVWVYRCRFRARLDAANQHKCDTLVVSLVNGVVAEMHLVNARAQVILAARSQAGSPVMLASTP